jgi:hypothetical protein
MQASHLFCHDETGRMSKKSLSSALECSQLSCILGSHILEDIARTFSSALTAVGRRHRQQTFGLDAARRAFPSFQNYRHLPTAYRRRDEQAASSDGVCQVAQCEGSGTKCARSRPCCIDGGAARLAPSAVYLLTLSRPSPRASSTWTRHACIGDRALHGATLSLAIARTGPGGARRMARQGLAS